VEQDREDQHAQASPDTASDPGRTDDASKSSGGITGGDTSLSAAGTTSGGLGSGASAGTGGDVGNWEKGGSAADAAAATEDKKIVYPTGTSASAVGDWNARQSGTGRESGAADGNESDAGSGTDGS